MTTETPVHTVEEPSELDKLAELIEETTGNVIPKGQYPHLEQVALERARQAGLRDLEAYVELLAEGGTEAEWRRLLPDVTIKESFLFRIPEQFKALRDRILPQLAGIRPDAHKMRVWSAGCARGEEPATLAVVMAECPFLADRSWEVVATDVDDRALDEARRAVFGERAVAQVPPHLLRTWFDKKDAGYVLSDDLRQRIELRHFNFFRSPYLGLGPVFDVIFLRNVLIYFNPEAQRRVVKRVISRLAPDGFLFLGHSESLWQLSDEMEPLELDNCFVYRRRTSSAAQRSATQRSAAQRRTARHKTRVERPAAPLAMPAPTPPIAVPPAAPGPRPEPRRPEQNLAEAARALTEDRLDDARALVDRCLEDSKSSAEVHSLNGLLLDVLGEPEAAVSAYRAALFLEPRLYQIRFLLAHRFEHLDLLARARHEYRHVLTDLEQNVYRELSPPLGGSGGLLRRLLPQRDEAARRCRRALDRI